MITGGGCAWEPRLVSRSLNFMRGCKCDRRRGSLMTVGAGSSAPVRRRRFVAILWCSMSHSCIPRRMPSSKKKNAFGRHLVNPALFKTVRVKDGKYAQLSKQSGASEINQLAERLRGVQLTRAVTHDQQSVATSCVSYFPTLHATSRLVQRSVSKRDVQECIKHGTVHKTNSNGRLKMCHRGVTVIATTEKIVVTAWRSYPMLTFKLLWDKALLRWKKRLCFAFRVWRMFPFIPRWHARWLLNFGSVGTGANDILSKCFLAWALFSDNQHAIRVSRILRMDPAPPPHVIVRVRQLFGQWARACHPAVSLRRARKRLLANARHSMRVWKWVTDAHTYTPLWSARYRDPNVDHALWKEFGRTL